MSYDVQVFAQRALTAEELRRLLAAAGLAVDDVDEGAGDATGDLTVVRGARAHYSFTLGLPVAVEAEEVPEEVTAALLGPSYLYELLVEGSPTTETPHAVRFARRLAQASGGVVLDQQTGQVWARGKLRAAPPVERGRIDVVDLRWYVRPEGTGARAAQVWLDLARRHLPEAQPRRFGSYEPLPMELDVDGLDAFVRAAAEEGWSLSFSSSRPCIGGGIAGGAQGPGVHAHSLSVHREPLTDPRWQAALLRLFVDFATATDAVYASAEVQRGVGWSGRSTWYDSTTERTTYLATRGRWAGLPPYPVWWSWFGPDYLPLVIDHLPADEVRRVGRGLLHARGGAPLDRDRLTAAVRGATTARAPRWTPRALFARLTSTDTPAWLPAELSLTEDLSDPTQRSPPATPAPTIPPGLRSGR